MPCVDGRQAGRHELYGQRLSQHLARDALGCQRPLQQGRRLAESLSRPRHPAARPDGRGYRRPRCVPRVVDERGLQGTREQGAGAPARALPDEATPARHREGLWPESARAQAPPPVIKARPERFGLPTFWFVTMPLFSVEGLLPRNAAGKSAVLGISIRTTTR